MVSKDGEMLLNLFCRGARDLLHYMIFTYINIDSNRHLSICYSVFWVAEQEALS